MNVSHHPPSSAIHHDQSLSTIVNHLQSSISNNLSASINHQSINHLQSSSIIKRHQLSTLLCGCRHRNRGGNMQSGPVGAALRLSVLVPRYHQVNHHGGTTMGAPPPRWHCQMTGTSQNASLTAFRRTQQVEAWWNRCQCFEGSTVIWTADLSCSWDESDARPTRIAPNLSESSGLTREQKRQPLRITQFHIEQNFLTCRAASMMVVHCKAHTDADVWNVLFCYGMHASTYVNVNLYVKNNVM